MDEEVKDQVVTPEAPKETIPEQKPLGALFDSISYNKNEDVPIWLEKMAIHDALFTLISAAAYGHKKGIYNLLESEAVSKAIRIMTVQKPKSEEAPVNPNIDPPLAQ